MLPEPLLQALGVPGSKGKGEDCTAAWHRDYGTSHAQIKTLLISQPGFRGGKMNGIAADSVISIDCWLFQPMQLVLVDLIWCFTRAPQLQIRHLYKTSPRWFDTIHKE